MPTIYKPGRQKKNDPGNQYAAERRKIYNTARWLRLRAWKFNTSPLCERCLAEGRITPAEDIHHIRSFMSTDDPALRRWLAFDPGNLMSLCKKCHQLIHNSHWDR